MRFAKNEIEILETIVSSKEVKPDPEKSRAIKNFKTPITVKELRSFLGLANYAYNYFPNFVKLATPLYPILKRKTKRSTRNIKWT